MITTAVRAKNTPVYGKGMQPVCTAVMKVRSHVVESLYFHFSPPYPLYLTADSWQLTRPLQVSLHDPESKPNYWIWIKKNCQKCHWAFLWMAEKLTFPKKYKDSAGYSCNIYGWKHNRGRDLQRCQQLSRLLYESECTHIKAQLDSSIIRQSSLPAASPSQSSELKNTREEKDNR